MAYLDKFNGKISIVQSFLENASIIPETENPDNEWNEQSASDDTTDYTELIKEEAFIGEYPYSVIKESLLNQFGNYIANEDKTNYAEVFYKQWHDSWEYYLTDEEEEHPAEIKEALNQIMDDFTSTMYNLFRQRLTLTIVDIDNGEIDPANLEGIIRLLYEYFILDAKKNFRTVISTDIEKRLRTNISDDELYNKIKSLLPDYSPLMLAVGPMEFLRYSASEDIINIFESGAVVGNFLRRYSCKLYEHEEFEADIISHIIIVHDVKEEFQNAYGQS